MTRPRSISLKPPVETHKRNALRLLAMVLELHKAGFQKLRVVPGMSPSGCHWRCHVTTADNIQENGWEPIDWEHGIAQYTSGDENSYFGWSDSPGKSARELAQMLLDRMPDMARRGAGIDHLYAGWFLTLLGAAEAGEFPVFYADYDIEVPEIGLPPSPLEGGGMFRTSGAE
jgi:hypothetical protein